MHVWLINVIKNTKGMLILKLGTAASQPCRWVKSVEFIGTLSGLLAMFLDLYNSACFVIIHAFTLCIILHNIKGTNSSISMFRVTEHPWRPVMKVSTENNLICVLEVKRNAILLLQCIRVYHCFWVCRFLSTGFQVITEAECPKEWVHCDGFPKCVALFSVVSDAEDLSGPGFLWNTHSSSKREINFRSLCLEPASVRGFWSGNSSLRLPACLFSV